MDSLIIITIIFYLLSTAGYVAYLFAQKNYFQKTAYCLIVAGFLCHFAVIILSFIKAGHIPAQNLHETLILLGWSIACVFIIFQNKFKVKIIGIYIAPLLFFLMILAAATPDKSVPATGIFKSFWLFSHIAAIFIGEAALALACGIGILYLIQEHAIKNKKRGFFYRRLPSLDLLDSSGYACIIAGFSMLTLGLITGIIYAKYAWGRFWSWDPKEVWSGITWLIYAALLHERLTVGWRGKKAAIMAIIGFAVILFTFFGVNFFLQGHHGDFTRW